MKHQNLVLSLAATALVVGVTAFSAAPAHAQGFQGYGGQMMGQGNNHGMMGSQGHGMMNSRGYGMMGSGNAPCYQMQQSGVDRNLGVDDVKGFVENRLQMMGNDRLKVGKVEANGDNTIVAEVVTVDDSLVHKIQFDTRTGAHHPIK